MLLRTLIHSSLLLGLASLPLASQEGPPGLILIKGGKTKVGTTVKDAQELIRKHRDQANTFAGETPQHTVDVADFYLMPTEVTNEQFAEFVRATGSKPPYYWCADINAARVAHLEEQGKLKQEAKERGERYTTEKWIPSEWWDENWEGTNWEVPEERLDSPVNYISYHDAEAYARWAGLRLMTEFEFQRAARGTGDSVYPWGDEWDVNACNSHEYKEADEGIKVGSFPGKDGVYDLIGNLWEWTGSKYNKYPGYKPVEVKVSRGEAIKGMAGFDPSMRIIVGGAYVVPGFACRTAVRMPAERHQSTEALGFRCAADLALAAAPAKAVLEEEVQRHLLPYAVSFAAPERASVLQRWESRPGTSKIEGYAVITHYERVLFSPVEDLDYSSKNDMGNWTEKNGPVFLGVISFPVPIAEPPMNGGTYYVTWREAGKVELPEEGAEPTDDGPGAGPAYWEAAGFNPEVDSIIFYDIDGRPVAALPSLPVEFAKMEGPGSMTLEPFVMPKLGPKDPQPIPMDTLRVSIVIPAKSRKGLQSDLLLKVDAGKLDASWK